MSCNVVESKYNMLKKQIQCNCYEVAHCYIVADVSSVAGHNKDQEHEERRASFSLSPTAL